MITKDRFISLEDDLLFKETMAKLENRHILEDFLETMLDLEPGCMHNKLTVMYESPIPKMNYSDRSLRGDLFVKYDNYIINIEMNSVFDWEKLEKNLSYALRLASNVKRTDLKKNKELIEMIVPIIQINLIDDVRIKLGKNIGNNYGIINHDNLEDVLINDKFQIILYRLDKARKSPYTEGRKVQWLKFLGAKSKEERDSIAKGDEILMEYSKNIDNYILDKETTEIYHLWDDIIAEHQAERRGREEANLETAKNMLKDGLTLDKIKKYTGLPLRAIKAISL